MTRESQGTRALCDVCRSQNLESTLTPPMETQRPLGRWKFSHILQSRQNCSLCDFVFRVMTVETDLPRYQEVYEEKEIELYWYAGAYDKEPGCRINLQIGNMSSSQPGTLIRTQPFTSGLQSVGLLPGATRDSIIPISGRKLGETVAWRLLKKWLWHCETSHNHDNSSNVRTWASCFRLVDIKNRCLVDASMSVRYAALSYVWGGSQPVRLSSHNLKDFMTKGGFGRLSSLPRAFQDAMQIAEQLEIDYLWIDALCIQHDDEHDLNHQINGMDQIYREATITIVNVTPNADCEVPGLRRGSRNSTHWEYNDLGVDLMYARPILRNAIMKSDWETRGWTLQEKFFSKRLLFFTTYQVYYQCHEAIWAEDAILEPPDFHASSQEGHPSVPGQPYPLGFDFGSTSGVFDDFFQYQDLLQEYMRRNLTRDTDILAAFSGILNSLEEQLGPSVYGLPERIFDAALLWYGKPRIKRRPQFPSWSWCGWDVQDGREISWLIVAVLNGSESAWILPPQANELRSVAIEDLGFVAFSVYRPKRKFSDSRPKSTFSDSRPKRTFIVPLPRPLHSLRELPIVKSDNLTLESVKAANGSLRTSTDAFKLRGQSLEYDSQSGLQSDILKSPQRGKLRLWMKNSMANFSNMFGTSQAPEATKCGTKRSPGTGNSKTAKQAFENLQSSEAQRTVFLPPRSHIIEFEAHTFFDYEYVKGDVKSALDANLAGYAVRREYQNIEFVVMSGCRLHDTWFKRRLGTFALPLAPGEFRDAQSANVNLMLIQTDEESGISERIWVFSVKMRNELPKTVVKVIRLA